MSEPLILVRWKKGVREEDREKQRRFNAMKQRTDAVAQEWAKVGIELYDLPPGLAKKTAEWLIQKGWADAEVDGEGEGIPIDPGAGQAMSYTDLLAGNTWYQKRVGIPAAWAKSTGKGVKLGVADSGANHEHEWLKSSIVASRNFVDNETTVNDNEGHGTACAGLVKAIARDCSLVIARVMSQNSAKWTAVGAGWIWLADQGCIVASTSIGGQSDSFSLSSAAAYCNERGCVPICAAGNAGTQSNSYPANTKGCIAVAATDEGDNKAGFSQWGEFIDIAAPGTNLLTSHGGGYDSFSGTSGSTPIVAGCVGLVAANYGMDGTDSLQALMLTCRNLGNDLYFGAGIPDLVKALAVDVPAPEPDPEPPPPEPPPPTTTPVDITSLAKITSSFPAFEAAGEGLANLTDGTTKKCLWFSKNVLLTLTFSSDVSLSELQLTSANDYPVRDPMWFRIKTGNTVVHETANVPFTNRHQLLQFLFQPSQVAKQFTIEIESSGQDSPGDKGQGILQIGELRVRGKVAASEPEPEPPPPPPPPPVTLPLEVIVAIAELDLQIPHLTTEQKVLLLAELQRLAQKAA